MLFPKPLPFIATVFAGIMLPLKGFCVEAETVLIALQKKYNESERLEYSGHYQLFKGHTGEDLHESYSTYFYRDGDQCFQKLGAAVSVFAQSFMLQLEHEERSIAVYKPQKAPAALSDIKTLLEHCKKSTCSEKGNSYEINLEFKPGSMVPYSSMFLLVSKKENYLLQMDLYYSAPQDFSENSDNPDMQLPHIRMTFSDISFNPKKQSRFFELDSYAITNENTLTVQTTYSGYSLTDNRLKK